MFHALPAGTGKEDAARVRETTMRLIQLLDLAFRDIFGVSTDGAKNMISLSRPIQRLPAGLFVLFSALLVLPPASFLLAAFRASLFAVVSVGGLRFLRRSDPVVVAFSASLFHALPA